jgi:hypothetical protein
MDETQTLAVLALRELLDNPDRNDWDELVAANRELIKAIATGRPMTRRNTRIVAEYLREAGWGEDWCGHGASRCPWGTFAKPDSGNEQSARSRLTDILTSTAPRLRQALSPLRLPR